ncbi:hypothetical protein N431DRAFT_473935 [Stipitochalara longipes BDJ]|nr:hypothetical protein N431DRAFT_473935 [Stipitochalara longipes BDJ]
MFLGNALELWPADSEVFRKCLLVELCDFNGLRTGVIESHFTDEKDYIQGSQCDLIAISILSVTQYSANRRDVPDMSLMTALKGPDRAVFYNVLWVEWDDGIAYRKAVGRVVKDAWEKQDLEEIEVGLG